jgi:hypothetical protein
MLDLITPPGMRKGDKQSVHSNDVQSSYPEITNLPEKGAMAQEVLQMLLAIRQDARCGTDLYTVYTQIIEHAPITYIFIDICPIMIKLFNHVTCCTAIDRHVPTTADPSFEGGLKNPPITPQRAEISQEFQLYPLNSRLIRGQFGNFTTNTLESVSIIHLINHNRHQLVYSPAVVEKNMLYVPTDYATYEYDPILSAMSSYCSIQGLSALFRRTGFGLLLEPCDEYLLFDTGEAARTMHTYNYDFGGIKVWFTRDNLAVHRIRIDNQMLIPFGNVDRIVYMRIISAAMNLLTMSIHIGIQHLIVADEWNYQFSLHVALNQPHPLENLIKPLTLGVRDAANGVALTMVNGRKTNILSTISDLEPSFIFGLANRYRRNIQSVADWSVLRTRIGTSSTTPLTNSLDAWWTVIVEFVTCYTRQYPSLHDGNDMMVRTWLMSIGTLDIGLVRTISMMYFNQVLHALSSNHQWVHDFLWGKIVSSVRIDKPDGLPSIWVHQRTIETAIGTTGNTVCLYDQSMADFLPDIGLADKLVFDQFHRVLQDLEDTFRTNPDLYLVTRLF